MANHRWATGITTRRERQASSVALGIGACFFAVAAAARADSGACCLRGGECVETEDADCGKQGGVFRGGACLDTACGGACCLLDSKDCFFTGLPVCNELFGQYQGDGSDCSSCPTPMPTALTYQGQLKAGGVPVNRPMTFVFSLWAQESHGERIAGPLILEHLTIRSSAL